MAFSTEDLTARLDRYVHEAADNLRFAKILVELGLDPSNITFDSLAHRVWEVFVNHITLPNMLALVGAVFFVVTLLMQTMVLLRASSMVGNVFFIASASLSGNVPTFLMNVLMLPINAIRIRQMLNLIKKSRSMEKGDTSMEWLKPFMTSRKYTQGQRLFKKGDEAKEMYITVTGRFLITEINIELPPGSLMGELGFLTPDNARTATVECLEDGQVLSITYDRLLEIYFQNPQFGYYFLKLTSQRLMDNIKRLENARAADKFADALFD